MFRPVCRQLADGIDECPDEPPRRLVARHERRRTPNCNRKRHRWLVLVGAGRAQSEIVDRVLGRPLERDAHDAPIQIYEQLKGSAVPRMNWCRDECGGQT